MAAAVAAVRALTEVIKVSKGIILSVVRCCEYALGSVGEFIKFVSQRTQ
jgi:hypothetical protein